MSNNGSIVAVLVTIQKFAVVLVLLSAVSLPLAGCNTFAGLGQDAKAAGEAISNAANDTKGY